ncbi:hypothetical protein CQW39_05915 [Streptomyces griseofuscus]|uniref:hypothetical protein n=1 Tax=Streptomyces griseofuscus TaxID=146922 RepID=UPI000F64A877|nr:hypothetical protein [Streptomyces griseofuscus]RRQ81314.1 hypothetical protein CQW39_05915 [Streptomyces griseofuscus]
MGGEHGDQLGIGAVGAQQSAGLFDGDEPGPAAGGGAEGPADALPEQRQLQHHRHQRWRRDHAASRHPAAHHSPAERQRLLRDLHQLLRRGSGFTGSVAVKNNGSAAINGSLGAGAATSFGFNANYPGSNGAPTATCTTG